jgi:hypothetical protein
MLKMTSCNRSIVVMGVVSLKGGSQEVVRPMATAQFKMEDVYIFCNVIEIFCLRKVTKTRR